MPQEILEATIKGKLVLFAGAGISTENPLVFPNTFYQEIASDLNLENANLDFPELMSKLCQQKNGRKLLLEKIFTRFKYCDRFQEIYRKATNFHSELSSIWHIKDVVTTNWDDFFEKECDAIPMVTAEDFAFYDLPHRKVFKIHGSISNYGSIVATTEDYKTCYKNLNKGVIGSYLKILLATKVIVFIGYSFRDFDFNKIYNLIKKELKNIVPHIYVVTIDQGFSSTVDSTKVTVINTDGAFFLTAIRSHLEGNGSLFPKQNMRTVWSFMNTRQNYHQTSIDYFFSKRSTGAMYNLYYQDGLRHAFDYLVHNASSGLSYNPFHINSSIEAYKELGSRLLKEKRYEDYVYVEGYIVGLHAMFYKEIAEFPFFYILGIGTVEKEDEFYDLLNNDIIYHKAGDKNARKKFPPHFDPDSKLVPHHEPFIG